ncbi:hypothetical protein Kpho02_10750 [Kitasatospora phosalacinea]|uniref:Uncharacterized protein n=1 Tax=Kitasatospora phosalacinea TaxID=2065 RepID=A0A9W6UYL0_9ACTN|nr:hypothetical protein Kpho02_10750 [Kitasatospora phosalacinea]
MGEWKLLAIGFVVRVLLAWVIKRVLTRVKVKQTKVVKTTAKAKIRKVVVDMIPKSVAWLSSVMIVHVIKEVGVIGSSSPTQGSRTSLFLPQACPSKR